MRLRIFLTAALVASFALSAVALPAEYTEWGQGPVQYFMTKDEAAQWKRLSTEDEAKAFVALFWARRDPSPETPRNEFREEYDRRVVTADKEFGNGKVRGAMTERGKALVLYGVPTKIERSGSQRTSAMPAGINEETNADDVETFIWTYEGDAAKKYFNLNRAQIRFVDRFGRSDFQVDRGSADLGRAQQRAIQVAVVNPNLTVAPTFAVAAPQPVAPAVTEPVVQTELTTESFKTAVEAFKAAAKNPYDKNVQLTWGEYVTGAGTYFVPVQLYAPKASGIVAGENVTFFGVVQDATGKNVLAFEEPAALLASKDDFIADRSLLGLPAGKHRGVFGIAVDGQPVAMTAADMELAGSIDAKAPSISQLILSNNVYPLSEAQRAEDPYAFGGLKVVPKGDRTFRPADELWYFFELRNPGLPEAAAPAAAAAPADPAAAAAPVAATAPKIQVKLDVEGTDVTGKKKKMSAPPMQIDAIEIKGVPGHYGVGSAIPLSSFKPGDYTFTVKVIDTVSKASYTLSEKFKVVE
jgi:GWxTD domain-containing protein